MCSLAITDDGTDKLSPPFRNFWIRHRLSRQKDAAHSRTILDVLLKRVVTLEERVAHEAAELPVVRVNKLMASKFARRTETPRTHIANVRHRTLVAHHVFLELAADAEFLRTYVTREPRALVVRLQQMRLQLVKCCEDVGTLLTGVWLCTGMDTKVTLHIVLGAVQLSTVRTAERSHAGVDSTSVCFQALRQLETLVAERTAVWHFFAVNFQVIGQMVARHERLVTHVTLVRFVSRVEFPVNGQLRWLAELLVAQVTFVRSLPTVSSAVLGKISGLCISFSTEATLKLSRMNSLMHCQRVFVATNLSAHTALVSGAVNTHVPAEVAFSGKSFLAYGARVRFVTVRFGVSLQSVFG